MAFADQPAMSGKKATALGIAVLVHIALGYAFITGLALKAVKVIVAPMQTEDIKEEKKPDEPPPPPPKLDEIPPYVPPPIVTTEAPPPPPVINTQRVAPPPPIITPTAPPNPPPAGPTQKATPRAKLQQTFGDPTNYPDASLRNEEQGTVGYKITIDTEGNVVPGSCTVTSSTGFERLDRQTCTLFDRRGKKLFNPALSNGVPMTYAYVGRFTWRIPKN